MVPGKGPRFWRSSDRRSGGKPRDGGGTDVVRVGQSTYLLRNPRVFYVWKRIGVTD
jgi:hypothetical protein